ncbi:unnamed protein product [Didymodactylos carnosus]|uniref:uDENN domain-containing protein n=1 Tax=Didymodactylos carnosus TaxID=1234261 RepID=A0A8S2D1A2_9BILA|nr:unnamed protein product [Didymodactylos carnosus]CAF3597680.1 unnamed protein product [Didymodactylos carnosus]
MMSKETSHDSLYPFQHGSRIRESVRSLPKGHFEQIRQMFDQKRIKHQVTQQVKSTKNLDTNVQPDQQSSSHCSLQNSSSSTTTKLKKNSLSSLPSVPEDTISIDPPIICQQNNVLNLPVTDDEKLKQTISTSSTLSKTTNIDDLEISENDKRTIEERYRDYLLEYQKLRIKLAHELLQHTQKFPPKKTAISSSPPRLKQSTSLLKNCSMQLSNDENKYNEKRIKRDNNNEQQQYSVRKEHKRKMKSDYLIREPTLLLSSSTSEKLDNDHTALTTSESLPVSSTIEELVKEHQTPIIYSSIEGGNFNKHSMRDSSFLKKQRSGYLSFCQDSSRLAEDHDIRRMASTRQFVSTISRPKSILKGGNTSSHLNFSSSHKYEPSRVMLHVKPGVVNRRSISPPTQLTSAINNSVYDIVQSNEDYSDGAIKNNSSPRLFNNNSRLYSSTSLSTESNSYDSNSSPAPSIQSKYSNDFYNGIGASASSSSSDGRTKANKWLLSEQKRDLLNPSKVESKHSIFAVNQCYDTLQMKDTNDDVFCDSPLSQTIIEASNSNLPQKSQTLTTTTQSGRQDISSISSSSSIISGTGTTIRSRDNNSMVGNLTATSMKSVRSNSSSQAEEYRPMMGHITPQNPSSEISATSYVVQTTIFPASRSPVLEVIPTGVGLTSRVVNQQQQQQQSKKIKRWNNVHAERVQIHPPFAAGTLDRNSTRKKQLSSTSSTGFTYDLTTPTCALSTSVNDLNTPVVKPVIIRNSTSTSKKVEAYAQYPLPVVSNPVYQPLSLPPQAPKKPPRTFEQNHHKKLTETVEKKTKFTSSVSSSSSASSTATDSPTFDLGARSISCMDLTAGVSKTFASTGLLPLTNSTKPENIYEELKTPLSATASRKKGFFSQKDDDVVLRSNNEQPHKATTKTTTTGTMKKGISEPNLATSKQNKGTLFSPRNLFDRFKRMVSLSKTSLNTSDITQIGQDGDSDDSISTTDNFDEILSSHLDHVSRIKNVYDSLGEGHTSSLYIGGGEHVKEQITTLYDYVILIIPEFGCFQNENEVTSTTNSFSHQSSSSVKFKYPPDAKDEPALIHFCFPEWDSTSSSYTPPLSRRLDQNNNNFTSSPLLTKNKFSPEYFRFTLTDMFGQRQHGYCSRFLHKGIVNALCIMSPFDMLDFYFHILSHVTDYFLSYKDEDARKFLKEIYPHKIPARGDSISIQTQTSGLFTLKCEYDRRKELIDSENLLNLSTGTYIYDPNLFFEKLSQWNEKHNDLRK